jgi:hypothetical protein
MKRDAISGDLPPVTSLRRVPVPQPPISLARVCAVEIMENEGIPRALRRAVLADEQATNLVFRGV